MKCFGDSNQYGIDHGSKNFSSMRVLMQRSRMRMHQNIYVVLLVLLHSCYGNALPKRVYKKFDGTIWYEDISSAVCF